MRPIRLRIRLKRGSAKPSQSRKRQAMPSEENLPGRDFPPVPDGRAVPKPPAPPGELPAREGPVETASTPRRPAIRVSPAMAEGEPQVKQPAPGRAPRRPEAPFQPVLPSLGTPQAAAETSATSAKETDMSVLPVEPAAAKPERKRDRAAISVSCCPSCGEGLAVRPHMKSNCPDCGKAIHVRGGQAIFPDGLVPDDEVDAVDLMERLEPLGITQDTCLDRLQRDEKGRPRSGALAALLRELCEERLPELLPATQVRLLHEMARERQWRSEDPRPLLRRAQVILLQKMRDAGVTRVRMACSGSDACPACREMTGRSLSMEDALAQQMLPNADCRHPGGLCRCRYTEAESGAGATGGQPAR